MWAYQGEVHTRDEAGRPILVPVTRIYASASAAHRALARYCEKHGLCLQAQTVRGWERGSVAIRYLHTGGTV